ncbi:MAG: FAD-binding protein [Alistipes sp.]|nr:FAD-binding protein [Alistipes sp.]
MRSEVTNRQPKWVVLVKQVPDTSASTCMTTEGALDRTSLSAMPNPDDLGALELALAVRDRLGGTVTAVSMGLERAEEVLRAMMARGADDAVVLADCRCAGADVPATACMVAAAARKLGAEALFAGCQSIGGDLAHVGSQVAEELGIPQVTEVEALVDCSNDGITVRRRKDEAMEVVKAPLSCLFAVRGTLLCRPENIHRLLQQRRRPIRHWKADMLDIDPVRLSAAAVATGRVASEDTAHRACVQAGEEAKLSEEELLLQLLVPAGQPPSGGLQQAPIVVAGGYGACNATCFARLEELAALLGAELGGTRAAVDAGYLPHERMIGQTGLTVAPRLYLAFGISGQVQHTIGIARAGMIVAVNRDPEAPICRMADHVITGDAAEVAERMIRILKTCKR